MFLIHQGLAQFTNGIVGALGECLVTRRMSFTGVDTVHEMRVCCVAPQPH